MKRTLVSFLFVVALLPVVIFGAVMRDRLSLSASADAAPILRVWFEPSSIVLSSGQSTSVRVMAESEAARKLVGSLYIPFAVSGDVELDVMDASLDKSFLGRSEVGKFRITSFGEGGGVEIDRENAQVLPSEFVLQFGDLKVIPN